MRLQAVKRSHCDVFRSRDDAAEKIDVSVQVAVVDRVDKLATQNRVDVLEVDDHPGHRIQLAADRDLDHVVVAVIGRAGAEDVTILLLAPVLATQDVRGGEGGPARDPHLLGHGSIRKLAPVSGADSVEASQTTMRATSAGWSIGPPTPEMRSIAVSTAPGLMALTRMRASRPSAASASVSPASPDLAAT